MKSILISIQAEHNKNIEAGLKTSELRTKVPKIDTPFKILTYESGAEGRHKVVNEWICKDITTWLMYMGLPAHLSKVACVSNEYIWNYCDKGNKNIYEMHISDLVIYDTPKELSEFKHTKEYVDSKRNSVSHWEYGIDDEITRTLKRPPQSWCYVEEVQI